MNQKTTGLPNADDRYSFEMIVTRNPRKDGEQPKKITSLTYHSLNYGALVQVENAVTNKLMPALSAMGMQVAEQMGYPAESGDGVSGD